MVERAIRRHLHRWAERRTQGGVAEVEAAGRHVDIERGWAGRVLGDVDQPVDAGNRIRTIAQGQAIDPPVDFRRRERARNAPVAIQRAAERVARKARERRQVFGVDRVGNIQFAIAQVDLALGRDRRRVADDLRAFQHQRLRRLIVSPPRRNAGGGAEGTGQFRVAEV